jgi:hypothetical protein
MKLKKKYPRWRFHKDLPQVLVQDEKKEMELPIGYGSWAEVFGEKHDEKKSEQEAPAEVIQEAEKPIDTPVSEPAGEQKALPDVKLGKKRGKK